ncbi:MAG: EAL domain-containing protein [Gammaproteobacteria bacterium]|nr:EAL domain-containing protein [Gammaproteobacteria bacterium]
MSALNKTDHRRGWDRLNWLSTALALGIATLLLISSETTSLREDFRHRLATQAGLVSANSAAAVVFKNAQSAQDNLAAFQHSPEILSARIHLPDGTLFASYQKPGANEDVPFWAGPLGLDRIEYQKPLDLEGVEIAEIRLIADLEPLRTRILSFIAVVLGAAMLALLIAQTLMARLRRAMRHAEDDMVHMAHYDVLTGLPNRALFESHTAQALARTARGGGRAALLFFDLDNFKVVNDSLGHPVGDQLLQAVAAQLGQVVRQTDNLSRLGGDEFTLLVEGAGQQQASAVAEHVIEALHQSIPIDGHELSVGASIGIALYPDDGDSVDKLLRSADSALYAAKAAGKHTWRFFSAEMDEQAQHRLALEAGLRRALDRNELRMVYQPIVDLGTGRHIGFEALMRWTSPELGEVSPAVFIPVAEETGLIHAFGTFALREACSQTRRWLDEGRVDVVVSVNVSARQFSGRGLVDSVRQTLKEADLPPSHLDLEITETALMGGEQEVVDILNELHDLGVSLSLDDFGIGYASLSQLKRLPIHKLKIDRSFVMDILHDSDDTAIVTAIIGMADALGLTVVAEGVETQDQQAFLAALGCRRGQGYLFGRPGPAE